MAFRGISRPSASIQMNRGPEKPQCPNQTLRKAGNFDALAPTGASKFPSLPWILATGLGTSLATQTQEKREEPARRGRSRRSARRFCVAITIRSGLLALVMTSCGNDDEPLDPAENVGWAELIVTGSLVTGRAGYYRAAGAYLGCESTSADRCSYSTCLKDANAAPAEYTSAGALSVTGAAGPIDYVWEESTQSYAFPDADALLQGGEALTLEAAGNAVPAHSVSLTMPSPLILTAPDLLEPLSIPATQDLAFTWTAVASGSLLLSLRMDTGNSLQEVGVSCEFLAQNGQGVVRKELLAKLVRIAPSVSVSVSVHLAEHADSVIPGWGPMVFYAAWSQTGSATVVQ
jgi:hypothetical protein